MAEAKSKKIRVYKLATEYNLSAENLMEFLQDKGFDVKSHMTILTDEMVDAINAHFKKDIEKAEKHYKKVAEFHKKRADKAIQEAKESGKEIHVAEAVPSASIEEIKITYKKEISEPESLAGKEKKKHEEVSEAEKITGDGKDKKEGKVKGLKVVGKMDLQEAKKTKPEEKSGTDEKEQETKPVARKRRKPRMKKKENEAPVEESPVAKKRKRVKRFEINEREVKEAIRKTLMSMDDTTVSGRASYRKKKRKEREALEEKRLEEKSLEGYKIKVNEFIAVNELANLMNVPVADVISKFIELGLMVSINQRLDVETITLVADEFGFEVEFQTEYTSELLEDTPDDPNSLVSRPPVVTIMGHVDHGKTSLLDYIRRTNVVAGESGGITQHIGAYKVDVGNGKSITFLDTPGHEAFTAMRARGAQITDIVVLIVAADDAVMPQTVEAINHAQAANVQIVIAINKIDKHGSNIDRIKQQLADRNILVETWGGKYQCVEISAKQGTNVDKLLETILLEAEMLDRKANPNRLARGVVVESELDRGKGITGTILVQKGTLKIGHPFIAGIYQGKVRAMFDERGNKVFEAPPSTPVQVLGFEGAPQAGDTFVVVESERSAREIGLKRQQLKREQDQKQIHYITLDEIAKQISIGGVKELPLIVKGDVDGSVEALADSLMKLSTEEVVIKVIHKGVGGISESDVLLADASKAIIIGFHVRPNLNARKLAEKNKVDIRLYNVIYDAIKEVKSALEGLLSPVLSEEVVATVEIRDIFKVPKFGTIAGCYVLEGKINRNNKIRLIREGIVINEGEIGNLKRFKDDVREVDAGYECGLNIANYNDIKVGDIIEAYKIVETKKTLA
ncbi:MAG TPA: translation initiation factor IF-2 [Ignavibacteriaceae bacterium]|nr:translation initiation factor IF-2 [Ignavibacteriaceae bacterium]